MKTRERDHLIQRLCYEQQFLTFDQICGHFFAGVGSSTSRRLKDLKCAGLIREVRVPGYTTHRLYRVTSRGANLVTQVSQIRVPQARRITPSTLYHDTIVTEVRLRLASFWNARWIPERLLKTAEYPQVPDGLAVFESGNRVAIEVENSIKHGKRYRDIWERWRGGKVLFVLYVATTASVERSLRVYLRKHAPDGVRLALVSWEKLRLERPMFWTTKGEFDLLSKSEF